LESVFNLQPEKRYGMLGLKLIRILFHSKKNSADILKITIA